MNRVPLAMYAVAVLCASQDEATELAAQIEKRGALGVESFAHEGKWYVHQTVRALPFLSKKGEGELMSVIAFGDMMEERACGNDC